MKNRTSKIRAKLLDQYGREVPKSEYDFELGDEDFAFRLKNPSRDKSGKYTVVLSNDVGEAKADVNMNFLSKEKISFAVIQLMQYCVPAMQASPLLPDSLYALTCARTAAHSNGRCRKMTEALQSPSTPLRRWTWRTEATGSQQERCGMRRS